MSQREKPDIVGLLTGLLFGLPILAILLWLAIVFVFVTILGRPDLCPLSLC